MDDPVARAPQCPYPRGVYWLPYTDEQGHRLIVAIDRHGRRACPAIRVFSKDDPRAVAGMLRRRLDDIDPEPIANHPQDVCRSPPARR